MKPLPIPSRAHLMKSQHKYQESNGLVGEAQHSSQGGVSPVSQHLRSFPPALPLPPCLFTHPPFLHLSLLLSHPFSPSLLPACTPRPSPPAAISLSSRGPENPMTLFPEAQGAALPETGLWGQSSPAVHNGAASPRGLVQPVPDHLPEGQQGVWGVGHAVVRPGCVVELAHR